MFMTILVRIKRCLLLVIIPLSQNVGIDDGIDALNPGY